MRIGPGTSVDVLPSAATVTTSIDRSTDAWLSGTQGNLELGAMWSVRGGGGALNAGATVNAWRDFIGLGATIGAVLPGGVSVGVGGYVSVSGDRTVQTLGEHDGRHRVEIHDRRGKSGHLTIDAGWSGIAVQGKWGASKTKKIIYRTDLPQGETAEKQAFPDLRKPLDSMRIADELVMVTEGEMFGSLMLGAQGLQLGVIGSMRGTFDLGVRRLDETHVEVTVRPRSMKEIGMLANLGGTVETKATHTVALAMRQTFVFDLSQRHAAQAYLRMLQGDLPTGLSSSVSAVGERDAEHLLDAVRREVLPEGVKRVLLEKIDVDSKLRRVGSDFSLILGDKGGLSYERLKSMERVVATDGRVAITRNTTELSKRWELLLSGEEKAGVFATHRRVFTSPASGQYAWKFDSLILRGRLSDTIVRGDEQNKAMVDVLNRLFRMELNHCSRRGHQQDREVIVERELGAKDFDAIAQASSLAIHEAAARTGLEEAALWALARELANVGPDQAASIVQRFVHGQGLPGFGALHRILDGDSDRLTVRTSSNAYTEPLRRAVELCAAQFRLNDPASKIDAFFHEARAILREVEEGLKDLEDDPFFTDAADRESRRKALLATKRSVESLLDLAGQGYSKEQRLRIYSKLHHKEIEQRLVVLKDAYSDPISLGDDAKQVALRFGKVERALRKLAHEKKRLDPNVADQMERELLRLIDLSHLPLLEQRRLRPKRRWRCFT